MLSLLLVAVIANSVLRGSNDALALNPLAAAAAKAENSPGFRFNLFVVYSSPALPGPLSAQGDGAYNADTHRTLTTLSLDNSITGPVRFVEVSDDTYTYAKSNTYSSDLPPGKEWVRTKKDGSGDTGLDFDEAMGMLSDSGNTRVVGNQSVNGKMTRRYRSEIAVAKLVELLREQGKDNAADAYEGLEGVAPTQVSAEAWVDRNDVLRRMRFVLPVPGEDGTPPMTMDMRMDLFGFGAHPDIQAPDPDAVVDGPLDSSVGAASTSAS